MASTCTIAKATAPLLLLLLVVAAAATPAAATATSRMPPTCLREAAALCEGSSTNAMACLKQLVAAGDARVSKTCGAALKATTTLAAPVREQQRGSRAQQLSRLLNEGGATPCTGTLSPVISQTTTASYIGPTSTITCNNICCKPAGSAKASTLCCSHVSSAAVCGGAGAGLAC